MTIEDEHRRTEQPSSPPTTQIEVTVGVTEAKDQASVTGISVGQISQADIRGDGSTTIHHADQVIIDAGHAAAPPAPGDPPYKGLDFYDVDNAPLFFGREKLTAELVGFVREHAFLAIVGASGSGKSSLARAGLIASLLGKNPHPLEGGVQPPLGSRDWRYVAVTPTAHPFEALARGLAGDGGEAVALRDALVADPRALADRVPVLAGAGGHLLLLVDQFEELFTLCKDAKERVAYVATLLTACDEPGFGSAGAPCTLILTVRADFYAQCIGFENLRAALETHQKPIGAMNRAELQRTIELPARAGQWAFQQGLVEQILDDVGDQPGNLPLLSYALLETWNRRSGRVMTLAGYQAAGGVRDAINRTAERVFDDLTRQGLGDVARRIFLSLVEPADEGRATRRREQLRALAPEDSQSPEARALLALSARDARLVTVDGDAVQISHEALITAWPKLGEWLRTYHDDLQLLQSVRDAAAAWTAAAEAEKQDLLTHRGGRLDDAIKLRDAGEFPIDERERAYLAACLALREQETAAERKRQRDRIRLIAGAAAIALVLALLAGVFGIQSRNSANVAATREVEAQAASTRAVASESTAVAERAVAQTASTRAVASEGTAVVERAVAQAASTRAVEHQKIAEAERAAAELQASIARVGEFAADARSVATDAPQVSLLLAAEAVQSSESLGAEHRSVKAEQALVDALSGAGGLPLAVQVQGGQIYGLAFSGDGRWLVAESTWGHPARLWNLEAVRAGGPGRRIIRGTPPPDPGDAAPDTPPVSLDASSQQMPPGAPGGIGAPPVLDDAASQQTLASSSRGAVPTGPLVAVDDSLPLAFPGDPVGPGQKPEFSRDGRFIAIYGIGDRKVRLWDFGAGHADPEPAQLEGAASVGTFSPDSCHLATGDNAGVIRVWDLCQSSPLPAPLIWTGHAITVTAIAYSPDGRWLATAAESEALRLWDLRDKRPLKAPIMLENDGWIDHLEFSAAGWLLASAGGKYASLWRITGDGAGDRTGEVAPVLRLGAGNSSLSSDGRWLAHAQDIWGAMVHSGRFEVTLHQIKPESQGPETAATCSFSGERLVCGDQPRWPVGRCHDGRWSNHPAGQGLLSPLRCAELAGPRRAVDLSAVQSRFPLVGCMVG